MSKTLMLIGKLQFEASLATELKKSVLTYPSRIFEFSIFTIKTSDFVWLQYIFF
jgi:hypothetical protein